MELTLKDCRELRKEFDSDWREIADQMANDEDDFEIANHRFIRSEMIDQIMTDELKNDPYILGCFNASFIASVTGWPLSLIEAAQKSEGYEGLGEALIQEGYVEAMAEQYAAADSYGHHFASYDHNEHEFGDYYYFRIN